MVVTLAQAQQNAATAYEAAIISEFRMNPLMDLIPFDPAVNPAGGGATLTYGYRRQVSRSTAGFRAINSEYAPDEATTEPHSTELKPLGGAYQIDRVLANIGSAASGEVAFQTQQKIEAVRATFADAVINGDTAVNADSFDGLSKALTGSTTEQSGAAINLSGPMDQAKAFATLEAIDDLLSALDGTANLILANRRVIQKVASALRYAGQYTQTPGPRDTVRITYGGVVLQDAGTKDGEAAAIIPVTAGKTDIYAVRLGIDGFHGVSVTGSPLIRAWTPDFTQAGAVKTGEVEMGPVGVALKRTRAAGVLRGVTV